jgi:hypothetical protein
MIKANQFQELIKQLEQKNIQKQKRIQEDMKLAEETLNDLYIRVQKCLDEGKNPPKYAEIHKILEKEVQDNLMFEQNFYLDITKNGCTNIYYSKEDFNNRIPQDQRYPIVDMINKVSDEMKEVKYKEQKQKKSDEALKEDKMESNQNIKEISLEDAIKLIKNKQDLRWRF